MDFKRLQKKANGFITKLKFVRDERAQHEEKLADLEAREVELQDEISDELRQIGIDLFNAKIEERLAPINEKCDAVFGELNDLVLQYIDKYGELVKAEAEKVALRWELKELRYEYEIWPKEAPIPDLKSRVNFCGIKDGQPYEAFQNRYRCARHFLTDHLGTLLRRLEKGAKK